MVNIKGAKRGDKRDAIKHLEKQGKDKIITEDDLNHGKKLVDDKTKAFTDKVDEVVKQKADEIMLD